MSNVDEEIEALVQGHPVQREFLDYLNNHRNRMRERNVFDALLKHKQLAKRKRERDERRERVNKSRTKRAFDRYKSWMAENRAELLKQQYGIRAGGRAKRAFMKEVADAAAAHSRSGTGRSSLKPARVSATWWPRRVYMRGYRGKANARRGFGRALYRARTRRWRRRNRGHMAAKRIQDWWYENRYK